MLKHQSAGLSYFGCIIQWSQNKANVLFDDGNVVELIKKYNDSNKT